MPSHRYDEWRELLNKLENLTTACYDIIPVTSTVPATSSTDVVPSTSGINIAAAAATSTTTSSTTTTTTTTIIGNHSDEVNTSTIDDEFGTENADYLDCEILEVSESDLTLPDITVTNFKSDPAESDFEPDQSMQVTTFRALKPSEKRSSNISSKFTHCDTSLDSDSD